LSRCTVLAILESIGICNAAVSVRPTFHRVSIKHIAHHDLRLDGIVVWFWHMEILFRQKRKTEFRGLPFGGGGWLLWLVRVGFD